MGNKVSLSHSEWLIMQEIWRKGSATFREICAGVDGQGWSKPAVAAFLKRMEKKGAIKCEDAKPVKVYYPAVCRVAAVREETRRILGQVYGGDIVLLAQSLVCPGMLDDGEIDELIDILRKGRPGK